MIRFTTTFLACCLLASAVFADVKAVINGPTEAKVGDLVVLSGRESLGDNAVWVQPQKIQTIMCGDGKDLAFATGTPGTYQFMLIVADKQATIDYVTHTVVVGGTVPVEPDPPVDPGEPTDPPQEYDDLIKLSRDSSQRLNDPVTASALEAVIRKASDLLESKCAEGQCPGLDETKRIMVASIEATLLMRKGNSRNVDWLNGWRVPINEKLKQIDTRTVPNYLIAMRAVATGLKD